MGARKHFQTGADSCACGQLWPCTRLRAPRRRKLSTKGLFHNQALKVATEIVDNALARSNTARVVAGDARVKAALVHMHDAHEMLDASCRDLRAVEGATPVYRALVKLLVGVRDAIRDVNLAYAKAKEPFKLDHNPTNEDIEHPHLRGCGTEPITADERDLLMRVLDVADPASDCAIGNDEIAKARELAERILP